MVEGREVEDEHLVNAPNWLLLDLRIDEGRWWSEGGLQTPDERRDLDLRRAVLTRTALLTAADGRPLHITQCLRASIARPPFASTDTVADAGGGDGVVTVRRGMGAGVQTPNKK